MTTRGILSLIGVAYMIGSPAPSMAQVGAEPPRTDLRLDLSQLYSIDDVTSRHISFSELRATADAHTELGSQQAELHLDGRGRYGWTSITDSYGDITRAYVAIGPPDHAWQGALGRQSIDPVSSARVDGASANVLAGDTLRLLAFGGLMPHPLTGDFDPNFLTGGVGYEWRTNELHHMGGVAADFYKGGLDRAYLTDRVYLKLSKDWVLHGFAMVDLITPSGFFGDMLNKAATDQSALERIDLTNANLTLRYQPNGFVDGSLTAAHNHTLLPNLWWFDYLGEQAAKRGFVIDGLEPVGTRRSNARLVLDFHPALGLTPYVVGRIDYDHQTSQKAYEGSLGLKIDSAELGYLDLSTTIRDYFGTQNQLASLALGTNFGNAAGLDTTITGLRVLEPGLSAELLLDLSASLWLDLKAIYKPLGDVRLMAMYQAFIDPTMTYQVGFLRVGYRFREL